MNQSYPQVEKKYWHGLFVLAILTLLVWLAYFSLRPDYKLHVNFYDVGQGDAIFIKTYQGNQVLIDGGPDGAVLRKLGHDLPFYDRAIDLLVLTHPHADHAAGLIEVLKRYKVKRALLTGVNYDSQTYKRFLELLKEKQVETLTARAGQKIYLDDSTIMYVLFPFADLRGRNFKDMNQTSIVVKLSFGRTDFLFTGDAGKENERSLLAAGFGLASEILKAGHHGSRFSTSEEFLDSVHPEFAVISAGRGNRYGHPHEEVLELFQRKGIEYLRTDERGDVRMQSDGSGIEAF